MLITAAFKNENESVLFYEKRPEQKDIPFSPFNKECKSQEMKQQQT